MPQEKVNEILETLESLKNDKNATLIRNKGAHEKVVLGNFQKDLKKLYKIHKDDHELALALYKEDHLDARSLATMIADMNKLTEEQFNQWMQETDSPWLINYQISVTLAGHPQAQQIATKWATSKDPKYVEAGFYTYCWLLGNRSDDNFTNEELLKLVDVVKQADEVSPAMAYFIECLGISYLPLNKEAIETAQELKIQSALKGIENMTQKGKLGFKRNYLRC